MNRKLTKRQGISVLATIFALTASLTACSSTDNKETKETKVESKTVTNLKWMVDKVVPADSEGQKYVEDRFGVKLTMLSTASADYLQRQQIMMSTGEVPDVMLVYDPNELKKYADQGLLAEVPMSLIEKYAPKTKAHFDKIAPEGWFYTSQNKKNYGLPTLYSGQYTTPVIWRTDLLKKAGVTKIPETIDEMTQAFSALKKIGVYGLSSDGNSYYLTFQKIFGAFGVMPTQWMLKDGKVVNGAIQPEAKEALAVLADWYKKGYIDPEFVSGKDLGPKFTDGKFAFLDNGNVNATDESSPNSTIKAIKKLNPEGTVEFGPLPKGPKGKSGGWSWGSAGNMYAFGIQMKDQPEKMKKALEILESGINDEEMFVRLSYGVKGKHWDFSNGTDLKDGIKQLPPYDDSKKLQEEGIYSGGKTFYGGTPDLQIFYKYFGEKYLAVNKKYGNAPVSDVFGKPDILPSAGQYWGDLKKLKVETYAKIIRGDIPVDDFDLFVKRWNDMGGKTLRDEGQAMYDSMKK